MHSKLISGLAGFPGTANRKGLEIVSNSDFDGDFAARCHEIQVGLGVTDVPDFETITELGMVTRLSLHIRGLPPIAYARLKQVASALLNIPASAIKTVLHLMEDIEFVKLDGQGTTIKTVIPNVPYYEDLYAEVNNYAKTHKELNELEQLTLAIVRRLARSPDSKDRLRNDLRPESALFERAVTIGRKGNYLVSRTARGREILLSPTYFAENFNGFADLVAANGATNVKRVLDAVRSAQGIPLSLILKHGDLGGTIFGESDRAIVQRMAQEGMIKPPRIKTSHSGENYFIFTPTPTGAALAPSKREIYERAMAIVAALRQGQFLPARFAINSPLAVVRSMRSNLSLKKATTEFTEQYRNLELLRIGIMHNAGGGFSRFEIIDTEENVEALDLAIALLSDDTASGMEVDEHAREAFTADEAFLDSLVAAGELRKQPVILEEDAALQLDLWSLR